MSNNQSRWYFSKESLINTPSRKCGIDYDKELSYRQQAANLIQDMGILLKVDQLCINTAIVYMHRFYIFHSFQRFHRNAIAACALFLAAKVEEQPRKLEYVIKVAHKCLNINQPPLDPKSDYYLEQAQELVVNENIMLQTLGFDIGIEHPHTFVIKCCQLVKASKDLAQTSYFMATNSLHLTTMCLQYRPTLVACVCIHLACKWSNWEIPKSSEGKDWFYYVDKSVTAEMLEELTSEFLAILDKCPSRLKRKILKESQGNLTNKAIAHLTPKEDTKVSPVKNEAKSKQLPASTSTSSGYNQPSTSKSNEPSTSTSTPTIPVPSMTKKQSPSPPSKKPKEEPIRTHSTTHSSQVSGQLSNLHNSSNMNAHNIATDSRQRSQTIKDEKKLSLLKNETKSKPPQPPPPPPPPPSSSSSSHSGQLSASRQSSEMSLIPPISSSEFDRRSPSPAARKNKKEILPPFLNKPQPNSHSSSGQSLPHNSVGYNPHFQGNSSFTNETRPRPAFKDDKISPIKNEVNRPKPGASVSNNHSSQAKFHTGDVSMNLNQSNAIVKKEKRSPSPADTRKRVDYPTNLQKSSSAAGHSSQQSGHSTYPGYKDKREKEKPQPQPQPELNNKSKERVSLDRTVKSEKVERLDRPERLERERLGHHDRVNKIDHHDHRERRDRIVERTDHHDNRYDRTERMDKVTKQDDTFDKIYSQLPPLQHLQPPPHQPINNPNPVDNFKDFSANSNEMPRMPRLIPQANQERFDRLMKLERSHEPPQQQQMAHQQLEIHQHQMQQQQLLQQFQLQQQQQQQQQLYQQQQHQHHQQLLLQQQHHQLHYHQQHQLQQQQIQQQHHHQQQQQQQISHSQPQLPQLHQQHHFVNEQPETGGNEDGKEGVIKGEFEDPGEKLLDSVNEYEQDQLVEAGEDDLDDKLKSKDKHHHRHHRHHPSSSSSSKHHHHSHGHKKHHKDKHKSKHKHKDKERDRESRHRGDHDEANHREKDFKLTLSVPKEDKSEDEMERPSPIKLKISKQKINYSGSESDLNSETPSSLRIVIPKDRLGTGSGGGGGGNLSANAMTRSDNVNFPSTSSSRKRKNSTNESSSSFQERDLKLKKEKLLD